MRLEGKVAVMLVWYARRNILVPVRLSERLDARNGYLEEEWLGSSLRRYEETIGQTMERDPEAPFRSPPFHTSPATSTRAVSTPRRLAARFTQLYTVDTSVCLP